MQSSTDKAPIKASTSTAVTIEEYRRIIARIDRQSNIPSNKESQAMAPQRPDFTGINHLKLAANDISKTRDFYCNILNFTHHTKWDHYTASGKLFAVMLTFEHTIPPTSKSADPNTNTEGATQTTPILCEIRRNEAQAKAQGGWDPITFGVKTKVELERAREWFEANGVKCSRVFTGLKGWVFGALDPDGKIVRVYCEEEHQWTTDVDRDEFWLR